MKRGVIVLIVLCVAILGMWIAARVMHIVVFYRITSASNSPAINPGQMVTASSLKKPAINAFVCFKKPGMSYVSVFRCIAKPGDSVEIRYGDVYVNNRKLDEPYVWNEYRITKRQWAGIKDDIRKYHYPVYDYQDSLKNITCSLADMKHYHFELRRLSIPKFYTDSGMFWSFKKSGYNQDNFGPVKVPQKSWFVLGDNRHNAYDSRYLGFVKENEIIATVMGK